MDMKNADIARILDKAAVLLELTDDNPFKIKAIEKAARSIKGNDIPIADAVLAGSHWAVEGVGKSIATYVDEIVRTGTFAAYEELKALVPKGVRDMARLPGLGAKKLTQLWREAGIESVEALLAACEANKIAQLKGFGAKSQIQLYNAALYFQTQRNQYRLDEATLLARAIIQTLTHLTPTVTSQIVGATARADVTIAEVEVLVAGQKEDVARAINSISQELDLHYIRSGENSIFFETSEAKPVVLHHTEFTKFATDVLFLTTDRATYDALSARFHADLPTSIQALWDHVQLPELATQPQWWKLPILNDLWGKKLIINDLLGSSDVQGIVHAHTTYSDGVATLEQMANACMQLGYKYLCISDHSRSAFYANGLSIDRVKEQWAEIDALNAKLQPFRIFKGIESDILADGSLDYPDEILSGFDFVIASVHSGLRMDKETATQRLMKAVSHPATTILGHPTGRLLLRRQGYEIDHQRVIDACAAHGVAIEINANPYRLDLDPQWIAYAQSQGVKIVICPDAHSVEGLDDIQWGVLAAQAGGLCKNMTLNAMSPEALAAFFTERFATQ